MAADLLSHARVNEHTRNGCMEGGSFPTSKINSKQDRMGTSETGHLKKFLITDVIHKRDSAHFSQPYTKDLVKNP